MFRRFKQLIRLFTRDGWVLWYALRHPRTPLWQKGAISALAIYAFSPIDFIPDVIPLLGLVDDMTIVPLGGLLVLKLLPRKIRTECEAKAQLRQGKMKGWWWLAVLLVVWLLIAGWLVSTFIH